MHSIRTIFTFQSSVFNTTDVKDYFINDCCFGDDAARALITALRHRGIETDNEPDQEDFGWYFAFGLGGKNYHIVIAYRPAEDDGSGLWIGWIERNVGLLSSICGGRNKGILPQVPMELHVALTGISGVKNLRWHFKGDFAEGREENGMPNPADP